MSENNETKLTDYKNKDDHDGFVTSGVIDAANGLDHKNTKMKKIPEEISTQEVINAKQGVLISMLGDYGEVSKDLNKQINELFNNLQKENFGEAVKNSKEVIGNIVSGITTLIDETDKIERDDDREQKIQQFKAFLANLVILKNKALGFTNDNETLSFIKNVFDIDLDKILTDKESSLIRENCSKEFYQDFLLGKHIEVTDKQKDILRVFVSFFCQGYTINLEQEKFLGYQFSDYEICLESNIDVRQQQDFLYIHALRTNNQKEYELNLKRINAKKTTKDLDNDLFSFVFTNNGEDKSTEIMDSGLKVEYKDTNRGTAYYIFDENGIPVLYGSNKNTKLINNSSSRLFCQRSNSSMYSLISEIFTDVLGSVIGDELDDEVNKFSEAQKSELVQQKIDFLKDKIEFMLSSINKDTDINVLLGIYEILCINKMKEKALNDEGAKQLYVVLNTMYTAEDIEEKRKQCLEILKEKGIELFSEQECQDYLFKEQVNIFLNTNDFSNLQYQGDVDNVLKKLEETIKKLPNDLKDKKKNLEEKKKDLEEIKKKIITNKLENIPFKIKPNAVIDGKVKNGVHFQFEYGKEKNKKTFVVDVDMDIMKETNENKIIKDKQAKIIEKCFKISTVKEKSGWKKFLHEHAERTEVKNCQEIFGLNQNEILNVIGNFLYQQENANIGQYQDKYNKNDKLPKIANDNYGNLIKFASYAYNKTTILNQKFTVNDNTKGRGGN